MLNCVIQVDIISPSFLHYRTDFYARLWLVKVTMEVEYARVFSSVSDDLHGFIEKKYYHEYPRKHSKSLEGSSVSDDLQGSIEKKFYYEYPRKHSQTLEVMMLLDSVNNETYSGTCTC